MSQYSHDLRKFADSGLQLRLPVDLVPANQYSRLTNVLPQIEGELVTRDGMTLVANVTQSAFVYKLERPNTTDGFASVLETIYPNGYIVGDTVVITVIAADPSEASTITPGSYTVTITGITDSTGYGGGGYGLGDYGGSVQFTFTPGITVGWSGTNESILVFAQAVSTATTNVLANTPITNLFRLNQAITSLAGDRIAAIGGRVFHAPLPNGNAFAELVGPVAPGGAVPTAIMGFSGRPLVIANFRFTRDSASWAILADQNQMYKYRPGTDPSQLEFVPLGNAPPTAAATASAGGVGNLNSTGGTGYDWRYTYVDGYAYTESNPSPINMTGGGVITTRPTAFTNPAVSGDTAFANPSNAFDASTTSYSLGSKITAQDGTGVSQGTVDCLWDTWAPAAGDVSAITLNVKADLFLGVFSTGGGAYAQATATIYFSFDGGLTFSGLKSVSLTSPTHGNSSSDTGITTFSTTIPSAAPLTNIIVKAVGTTYAFGVTTGITDYLAQATVKIYIYDINTSVTEAGTVNSLALVNKIGKVCVTPSPLPEHKFINLYRRGGSLPDAWRFVSQSQVSALTIGTCGAGTLEIDDNVSDTTLSTAAILQLDNDQPVTSVSITSQPLPFIWGPVGLDARLLACGDPARPESVYFSKPGNADAWPPQNYVEVSNPGTPIIAGCMFNTRTFAFSRESIYELVEGLGTGATYTPFRTPSAHGLYLPYALAVGPAMYFVAKDGIYMSTGGQEQSIVENDIKPLFPTYDTPGRSVNGYEAVDMTKPDSMRLRYHNDELYFCYAGLDSGTQQVLIYDILKKRWRGMTTTTGITELYTEPATTSSLLYGTTAGTVYQAGGNFDPSDLDVIGNVSIAATTIGTSFPTATYYARAVRYTSLGAVAISYEFAVAVSATTGIVANFPARPAGEVGGFWRVFYGTTSGAENQYVQTTASTVTITATGTAGTVPVTRGSNDISVILRTGAHDQGAPLNRKQYGNVIIDLDPGGATVGAPVTITPYTNGEVQAQAALTVTGAGRQQVPLDLSDFFAFNTEYEVSWNRTDIGGGVVTAPVLFQYDTLHFMEPVGVKHWQAQPTSFEFPGFVHVRDCYIAIRSTAAATLTVTIDGVTVQTYTIASTGGVRKKVYIQLDSNKGLMYQFAVDSEVEFRVYEQDIEFRVKPWLGLLGYSVQRVVGGEVNA